MASGTHAWPSPWWARSQPHASPSLCTSAVPFSCRERPWAVPPQLPMDVPAPSCVLVPTPLGSPSREPLQDGACPGEGRALRAASPPQCLTAVGSSQWAPHPGARGDGCHHPGTGAAGCHRAIPHFGCHAGVAGHYWWRGAVAGCLCPLGVTWVVMAAREGELGAPSPVGMGMGWELPCPLAAVGGWPCTASPSCLCCPVAAALQSCFLGPQAAVGHPSSPQAPGLGAARGPVSHRGCSRDTVSVPGLGAAFPAPPTLRPSPSAGISPPAPAFPPH